MAKKRVGKFPKAFRQMAVDRLRQCENIVELAKELGIHRRLLYRWRDQLEPTETGDSPPPAHSRESTLRKEVSKLKRLLVDKTMEIDVFKGALRKVEARRQGTLWRDGIYEEIRDVMPTQGALSIERMCQLARVSRASFAHRRIGGVK